MTRRATIKYSRRLTPEALDDAEQELLRTEAPVYQQGGAVVQLVRLNAREAEAESKSSGIQHKPGALLIRPVSAHLMLEIFLRHMDFGVWSAARQKFIKGAPPLEFARHYLARERWNLRVLNGIVEAPTMRPDGTILSAPGYDEATGLFLDTGGVAFPDVPAKPTRRQSEDALELLKDLIKDFPFVPDAENAELGAPSASRSVALAAILTGGCRKSLPLAPAFGFDATTMATGKSLLCSLASMMWLGRSAASMSQGKTEEEFDKRLFAIALQGDPVVIIDNIDERVRSGEFCKMLTEETIQGRVLGGSINRTASTQVLWMLNGNGLTFESDIHTRVLLCQMDARVEDPGARKFDRNLHRYVPENRSALVAAALTVLRGYVAAGRPGADELSPFRQFEDWSRLVRAALVWLGEPDPCSTRETVAALDPERATLSALMSAWEEVVGTERWLTARELLNASESGSRIHDFDTEGVAEALADAIRDITPLGSVKVLGKHLTQFAGRIVDGRCIRKHATSGHATRFALEVVG